MDGYSSWEVVIELNRKSSKWRTGIIDRSILLSSIVMFDLSGSIRFGRHVSERFKNDIEVSHTIWILKFI